MQPAPVQPAMGQPAVNSFDPEGKHPRPARHRHGDPRLELGEQACAIRGGKGGFGVHKETTTRSFPLCSEEVIDSSSR